MLYQAMVQARKLHSDLDTLHEQIHPAELEGLLDLHRHSHCFRQTQLLSCECHFRDMDADLAALKKACRRPSTWDELTALHYETNAACAMQHVACSTLASNAIGAPDL